MVDTKKIFTVWSDKAVDRLDPFFYIPSEYKFDGKYLGDFIIKITSGKNVNRQNFTETGIPFLRVQNLKKYEIEPGELFLPNDAKYPKTGIETFLTGRVGSLGVFVQARGEYFYSDNALAIEFDDNSELNLDFLEAVLNSPIVTEQIIKLSKGNNQKLVSQETIKNLKIPVPPLSVQNQIVARIQQAYEEKKQKEAEIKTILASIDSFVLGELGIEIERERERE